MGGAATLKAEAEEAEEGAQKEKVAREKRDRSRIDTLLKQIGSESVSLFRAGREARRTRESEGSEGRRKTRGTRGTTTLELARRANLPKSSSSYQKDVAEG